MQLPIILAASLAPLVAQANVGLGWSFPNAPAAGLNDVTFPLNMKNAKHDYGYYYAMQFAFYGISDVGYTGLQPQPDQNGQSVVHAAFSSFAAGTTTSHPNCYAGADGGPGVSCALDIFGTYNTTYNMVVDNPQGTTWRGRMIDTQSGQSHEVGIWTLPNGAGKIKPSQVGFVEYYPWNRPEGPDCPRQPRTEVTFSYPKSTTSGSQAGTIGKPYDYGDCKAAFDFQTIAETNAWRVLYGQA